MDITTLILEDHHEQQRMFALLDDIDRQNREALGAVWQRLRILLEVHAEAEERFFYPHLLKVGTGATDAEDAEEETRDAIEDHNEIRDAVALAQQHEVGSDEWWNAVDEARKANDDHMAEEERQGLADFRRSADLQTRHELGVSFVTYESLHADGIRSQDKDPDQYIEQHS
jgi:hypothetical protein